MTSAIRPSITDCLKVGQGQLLGCAQRMTDSEFTPDMKDKLMAVGKEFSLLQENMVITNKVLVDIARSNPGSDIEEIRKRLKHEVSVQQLKDPNMTGLYQKLHEKLKVICNFIFKRIQFIILYLLILFYFISLGEYR